MDVSISRGNSKLGYIASVSLPAGLTCRNDCECNKRCYARKIEKLRPAVHKAYMRNYRLLYSESDKYWRQVEASIMMSRFFRFHVSGDIPDNVYFAHMVDISQRNTHCKILCFTKKYEIVNEFLEFGGKIPDNLHIVFSGWQGLDMNNPFSLPEAHVRYRDGSTTAAARAKECGGNCTDCGLENCGCWTLKNGEQVVFNEH